jgi:hypothetical protein
MSRKKSESGSVEGLDHHHPEHKKSLRRFLSRDKQDSKDSTEETEVEPDPVYAMLYELRQTRGQGSSDLHHDLSDLPEMPEEIELLSPKQNGSAVDAAAGTKSSSSSSIRGMWKKAVKSLKKDKPKPDKSGGGGDTGEKGAPEEKPYKRMHMSEAATIVMQQQQSSRQSSLKKGLLKRKDSKDSAGNLGMEDAQYDEDPEPVVPSDADPVFVALKYGKQLRKKTVNRSGSQQGSEEGFSQEGYSGGDPASNLAQYGEPSSYYGPYQGGAAGAQDSSTQQQGARPKHPYP